MVARVTVEKLVTANDNLTELLKLNPWIRFRATEKSDEVTEVVICTFSDASFNQNAASEYGQTGTLTGFRVRLQKGFDTFHPIDWVSNKQPRVSYSAYGADILACADGDDRGYHIKEGL